MQPLAQGALRAAHRFVLRRGLAVALLFAGCAGEDSGIGPDDHHRVAGAWTGVVEGSTTSGPFQAVIHLYVSQSQGTLSGSYDYTGSINDPDVDWAYPFSGSGSLTGTLEPGPKPGLTLTLSREGCPEVRGSEPSVYGGSYDAGRKRISVTGTFELGNDDCYPLQSILHSMVLLEG